MALHGANVTAQWYQDNYPGGAVFTRLEKFLLHTTETTGWPGYSGGASAPNATYHPRLRQIRQHFSNNRSSRALVDPSSTPVRENRDNVFQLEIIAYSDKNLGDSVGGLWVGDLTETHMEDIARMGIQLHDELGLPLTTGVTWTPGKLTPTPSVRLSSGQYDAARGWVGHMHASGNEHWDPGGFRMAELLAAIAQLQGDDMPLNAEDKAWIRAAVRQEVGLEIDELRKRTGTDPSDIDDTNVRASDGGRYGYMAARNTGTIEAKVDQILTLLKAPPTP